MEFGSVRKRDRVREWKRQKTKSNLPQSPDVGRGSINQLIWIIRIQKAHQEELMSHKTTGRHHMLRVSCVFPEDLFNLYSETVLRELEVLPDLYRQMCCYLRMLRMLSTGRDHRGGFEETYAYNRRERKRKREVKFLGYIMRNRGLKNVTLRGYNEGKGRSKKQGVNHLRRLSE